MIKFMQNLAFHAKFMSKKPSSAYYEQLEGAAMGSPVSSIVADLYMEFFEALAISTAPTRLRLSKRYVDDTFCIWTKGEEHEFLNHLNSLRPTIQFTMELESDGSISFLDCELHRDTNGRMISKVYRKKTHTDRYLHFQSHHPVHVKRGVVRSLFDRVNRVTTSPEDLQRERESI